MSIFKKSSYEYIYSRIKDIVKGMERGKKVNIRTLLRELKDFDVETKKNLLSLFDFVYYTQNWSETELPRNRVILYSKIEELINNK